MPAVVVTGVGVEARAVPPLDDIYHLRPLPFAVSGVAASFRQYSTGDVAVGGGVSWMVTLISAFGLSQPEVPTFWVTK